MDVSFTPAGPRPEAKPHKTACLIDPCPVRKSIPFSGHADLRKKAIYTRGFMRTATHTGRDLGQVVKDQTWHAGTYSNYIPDSPDNGILVSLG
jgi:hypothetical protein